MNRVYGWVPDDPDPADLDFTPTAEELAAPLPEVFSLRAQMPPVYDQLQLGSCTANAIGGAVQFEQMKQGLAEGANAPSRLFIYYCERALEGTIDTDSGAQIRDGFKVIGKQGAPPEADWPYDTSKFAVKPPAKAYKDALQYEATYGRVAQSQLALQTSIRNERPIAFGFTVYESFESQTVAETGVMPLPKPDEQILGGHAVLAVGWKEIAGVLHFEVRNSWGDGWGDDGYFWMPAAYITNPDLASDFWHITLESGPKEA